MNEDDILMVPYIVYEGSLTRMERTVKRMFVALVVCIVCLLATNIGWMIYESQFETYTYDQDGEGINNLNYGLQGDLSNVPTVEDTKEKRR